MHKRKKILVTGGTGQLGRSFKSIADSFPMCEFIFPGRKELDFADSCSIEYFFKDQVFDLIINAAAYTAVDRAETEPELAHQINHLAVELLAKIARRQKSELIQISTDYVFSGQLYRPYLEGDSVSPINMYGHTKLGGEVAVRKTLKKNALIIRTSWLYCEFGQNFVKTIMKLGVERDSLTVVSDQVGTPTYAKDLALAIMSIVESGVVEDPEFKTNVVNFSNEGICSWYDFAKEILSFADISCDLQPVNAAEYPTKAKRPSYSVLNKQKVKRQHDLVIPYWKDSLKDCVTALRRGD